MLKRLITSIGVLYVHFPHVALLRLMGPRYAILVTRVTSFAHWLIMSMGAGTQIRRTMEHVLRDVRPDLPVSTVLRKHLMMRQQHFVEWNIYPTARGRRFARRVCGMIEGGQYLDAAIANGRGVIIAGFHFGMGRMNSAALMLNGYDSYVHALRAERYAIKSVDFVARAVMNKETKVEIAAGQKAIYHRPGATYKVLAELLRQNAMVVVVVDGMAGSRYVELPFLNGSMQFTTGAARLAAETGAAIVCMVCLLEGLTQHRCVVHPPIYCHDNAPASIEATVQAYVTIFEDYVRRYPWAWWSWRRMDLVRRDSGKPRFMFRDVPTKETRYYSPEEDRGSVAR